MEKISFVNDYSEGCHAEILKALIKVNYTQSAGYGLDDYSIKAKEILKKEMANDEASIHFVSGGTQANLTVIAHLLRPYEAVVACDSGHINVHESGSIEMCGHKVMTVKNKDGKIDLQEIAKLLLANNDEHTVKIRMVYISNATEIGTTYSLSELEELSAFCKQHDLYLFVDGARIANALMAKDNDLHLNDYARLCDVFYIGGTKNGALLGEAVVFKNAKLAKGYRNTMKQHGAMLAKGRLLAINFLTLFEDGLYYKLGDHANKMAQEIAEALKEKGVSFMCESKTNQIFPIFSKSVAAALSDRYELGIWEDLDEQRAVYRLVTSWATPKEDVMRFIKDLKEVL